MMQRQLCHLIAPVTANWQVLSRFPKFVPQSLRVAAPSFQTASARIHVEERRCWRNTVGRSFHASSRALGEDKSSAEQPSVLTKQDGERDVPVSRWSVGGPRPDRALATATYWDSFYTYHEEKEAGSEYDWYPGATDLEFMLNHKLSSIQPGGLVLHAGCGTSPLSKTLTAANPSLRFIHGDFSMTCLKLMHKKYPELQWLGLDCRSLPFADASLHAVVEKGTMDALLRGGDTAWVGMCDELLRCLRPGGILLQVTDEAPELRLPLLESLRGWAVSYRTMESEDDYEKFVYQCVKASP
mmetsp:Transcript_9773/g.23209  ORF Transcript_9773/g.23209 Transcript_9773/m.23209 type:complete len:298 (-) Transcript_9773:177-1070(-)